jgi:ABC-type Zn uptake system ZnuABC Zn-binding protein ZnuA
MLTLLSLLATGGCRPETEPAHEHEGEHEHEHEAGAEAEMLSLPALQPVDLGGASLKVTATTSIMGDVVAQVGGAAIERTTLMAPGQDPHSYEPTPQQMAAVAQSHVVFVNGWDLEEALAHALEEIAGDVPIVPISAGIAPLAFGAHEEEHAEEETGHSEDEHAHAGADPHVWFSVHNVEQWVENVERVLSQLDPAQAGTYEQNAAAYRAKLEELEAYASDRFAGLPAEKRYLVTNHSSFAYLAHEYDLHVLGTVLPAASTLAEPSASDLAALIEEMQEHDLCTLFTETTVSDKLAQTVAAELAGCDEVAVIKLYTGSIGPAGSDADSYLGMFRHNVDAIVAGLQ